MCRLVMPTPRHRDSEVGLMLNKCSHFDISANIYQDRTPRFAPHYATEIEMTSRRLPEAVHRNEISCVSGE
jgi:hypothetical protein